MGGGVVYNALVVRPGLFRAAVAYAPVSSDTVDNFDKWVRRDASRASAARAVIARLGTPEANPAAWAATSPRTYFGRITEPLLIHHGTADEDCPLSWSRESVAALRAKGKSVELDVYPGGRHTLTSPQWDTSIRRTEAFLAGQPQVRPSRRAPLCHSTARIQSSPRAETRQRLELVGIGVGDAREVRSQHDPVAQGRRGARRSRRGRARSGW